MKSFSLSDLNRQSGVVVDAAMTQPVSLTKRGKPKLVMLPVENWEALRHGKAFTIADAPQTVIDLLVEGLETPFDRESAD